MLTDSGGHVVSHAAGKPAFVQDRCIALMKKLCIAFANDEVQQQVLLAHRDSLLAEFSLVQLEGTGRPTKKVLATPSTAAIASTKPQTKRSAASITKSTAPRSVKTNAPEGNEQADTDTTEHTTHEVDTPPPVASLDGIVAKCGFGAIKKFRYLELEDSSSDSD